MLKERIGCVRLVVLCGILAFGMLSMNSVCWAADGGGNGKSTVSQLRGKLLYRKNQSRKLEKEAMSKDPQLKSKIESMDAERERLFVEANPKLKEIYDMQKELDKQIKEVSGKDKEELPSASESAGEGSEE